MTPDLVLADGTARRLVVVLTVAGVAFLAPVAGWLAYALVAAPVGTAVATLPVWLGFALKGSLALGAAAILSASRRRGALAERTFAQVPIEEAEAIAPHRMPEAA
ncbi:hypothetical protein [Acuticoccus sp.]|uniref:hypothetical protein n=1 Tax=Acuticoccus sp. TaxID=1904378 RepID=UPI003B52F4F3